jgi:NADH:ubiquinone oxidoreductase subunit 6 (subunit J)
MLPNFGWQAIAVYVIACVVLTLFAVALLPDRSRADLPPTPVLTPVGSRAASR